MNGARGLMLLTALLLGACGGTPEQQAPAPTEQQSLDRAARLAFGQRHYAQAATLYRATLEAALAGDDPRAIIDARFNLAVAQMNLGDYPAALDQATQADAERTRRGLGADPGLELLRATIHFRAGDLDAATAALEPLTRNGDLPALTRAKAHFLAGLVAADRGDADALRLHLARLETLASTETAVDRIELNGRLAGMRGDVDQALGLLDRAAAMRSLEQDYRGMVRVLASAGELAARHGRERLAGNYLLRAGRSAAQRDAPEARAWLEHARVLGERVGDEALALEAASILRELDAGQ